MRPLAQTDDTPRRGRPRTDARKVVDALRYRERIGSIWRELPATFGSWQTA